MHLNVFELAVNKFFRVLLFNIDTPWTNRQYLKLVWKRNVGYRIDFDNPITFSEKLQYLKLYNHKPEYAVMVDKIAVKDYVSKLIGDEYIIPTIDVWENVKTFDVSKLPEKFVVKCNHDSGSVVFCDNKDKFDVEAAKKKLGDSLKRNHYKAGREWPYKNVKPKIFAEKMVGNVGEDLVDYKVFCFNGKVFCTELHLNRYHGHTQDFYSRDWKKLSVMQGTPNSNVIMEKPIFYDEMVRLSEKLSVGIPHVRVDWYYVEGHLLFGEFTFFDSGGFTEYKPREFEIEMGNMIEIPKERA